MRRRLPPLNQIRSFEASARHQSFALAAAELGVTSAAVSKLVKSLEDYLSLPLFHRGPSHIRLTKYGITYLERLTPALDEIAIATAELTGNWQQSLTIAAFPSVSQRWLTPRWVEFQQETPEHNIQIKTILEAPLSDQDDIDAAIRVIPPNNTGWIWDKVYEDRLIPVCHPDIQPSLPQDLQENNEFRRIRVRTRTNDWGNWFRRANIPFDNRMHAGDAEFDSLPMAVEAALQGVGVIIALKDFVEPELQAGALVPAFPDYPTVACPYYLTYPPHRANHPTLRAFHRWLTGK